MKEERIIKPGDIVYHPKFGKGEVFEWYKLLSEFTDVHFYEYPAGIIVKTKDLIFVEL